LHWAAIAQQRIASCLENTLNYSSGMKTELQQIPIFSAQFVTILVCFLCNLLDGMDVLIISFAAPAIAADWNIPPSNLGAIFSAGLLGMTAGAMTLAPLADRWGRKPLMLLAAFLMSSCIYLTSFADSMFMLLLFRFLSGLGIGTMMASTAAMTAEFTPAPVRAFWVSTVVAGYPVGAVLTGLFSARILTSFHWQKLFELAGIITFIIIPIIALFIQESRDFIQANKEKGVSPKTLLSGEFATGTLQLWSALFLAFATVYFLLNWIPKLATDAHMPMEAAIYAGTIFNLGAILGIPTQGYLSSRYGLKKVVGLMLVCTALILALFGLANNSMMIMLCLFLMGFGIQGGFVGLYAVAARVYPTAFRATGVGWAIGIGRLGGIIGPLLGGLLVAWGFGMAGSFGFFAIPCILAGIISLRFSAKHLDK
jgi:MFS transporter, AAHS family, 4-hydroxybenzoate transporter